jgi:peroxidase
MSRKYQLLLLLTFVYTTTINNGVQTTTVCPTNCTCSVGGVISLRIDCRNRASADPKDPGVLRTEIDELLTHKTYANLSYLIITHSSLDQVPGSLCRLSKLKDLYLDRNKLTRLPDGCLTLMPELVNLSATDNFITELQDGLFDESPNLRRIYLHRNQISSIGVHVFSPTYQHNIEFVSLTDNCLDTLDVWPLVTGVKIQATGETCSVSCGEQQHIKIHKQH